VSTAVTPAAAQARQALALLAQHPERFDFFQAVRLLELAHPDRPRIGTSHRLHNDPVRFSQALALDFAPSTLTSFKPGRPDAGLPARLSVRALGLTGPNGPLPLHLTEYARDRQRNLGDATLADFLDVFHHRLLSLFYRAWAQAQPAVSLDRPQQDAFGRWLGALAGYGMSSLRGRDAVPDGAKLAAAGLLSRGVRSAETLAQLLGYFFDVPVQVRQWSPRWMPLPPQALTRLGRRSPTARLGLTAVIGQRVWDVQSHFQVVVGPVDWTQYRRFLPGGVSLQRLRDWTRNHVGFELECSVRLVLKRVEVPALRLGGAAQLGWSSWLGTRRSTEDADDAVLHPG
jgi:type VI secretion system protein ImpH